MTPLARASCRLRPHHLVCHGDRLAKVGDGLLEGGAAKSLVSRLAPPFDREVVEARFGEMVGDRLGLRDGFTQDFGGAAMQRLAAALEQALVGRVLDQCVLEAVAGLRRRAFDE